ncbi:MAG TPA: winged helix-turn-helix domain-containing protein [Acidimicrobiales bacterium]|nr:winged helix-turn-helix domain-containing protein [Acidimicrobiales bacterium]
MSGKVTGWVVHNGPGDRVTLLALMILADAARNDGTGIRLGMREIARRARMSLGAANSAVRQLADAGWIEVVSMGSGGVPSEYRIALPHAVDNQGVVQRTERPRSAQSERPRSAQSERPYRGSTGMTGFTGAAGSGNGRGVRPPSTAEQARIDQCPACDDHGWIFDADDHAARCDHPSVPAKTGGRT